MCKTEHLETYDFCQSGCLVHMNWKNIGVEKHGQIKVKPHENVKLESYYASNALSPVLHAQQFEKDVQVDIKIPTFFH